LAGVVVVLNLLQVGHQAAQAVVQQVFHLQQVAQELQVKEMPVEILQEVLVVVAVVVVHLLLVLMVQTQKTAVQVALVLLTQLQAHQ
jgi:hypothetical protein